MAESVTGVISGGEWKKVLWGWGFYKVRYGISLNIPGGKYKCYVVIPISSGTLPNEVTHIVAGYGDVWIWSPSNATYRCTPIFP
jgi:hypothetical protein